MLAKKELKLIIGLLLGQKTFLWGNLGGGVNAFLRGMLDAYPMVGAM